MKNDNFLDNNINLISVLESEAFKGIGSVLATRLISNLGAERLVASLRDKSIGAFDPVKGIGKDLAEVLISRYTVFRGLVDLAVEFDSRGFKKAMAKKFYNVWEDKALDVIDSNPYVLLASMDWEMVDALERPCTMSFHPCRVVGAIEWCMYQDFEEEKNTCTSRDTLFKSVNQLIGCNEVTFDRGLDLAIRTGAVVEHHGELQVPATHWYERLVEKFLGENNNTDKSEEEISDWLKKHRYSGLNPQQKDAVVNALQKRFSAYYGRGGRGKTFTLKAIAHGATAPDMLNKKRVILTAVANKAVKRMQAETKAPAENCRSIAWLIYKEESQNLRNSMIVIDEASMLSLADAFRLFKKIQHLNTHVVFLGDHQQIPSIQAGRLFYDIITNNVVPNVELIKSHRHDETTDKQLSEVLEGTFPKLTDYVKGCGNGLHRQFVNPVTKGANAAEKEKKTQQIADEMAVDLYLKLLTDEETKHETTQIISPLRRFEYGGSSERINHLAHGKIWGEEHSKTYKKGTPVVWKTNIKVSSGTVLSNGSTGQVYEFCEAEDEFYMGVAFDLEGPVKLKFHEVKEGLDFSYCLSVHRAQGSEWDNVIIVLPKCQLIDRNMVYTALSRCRKRSIVVYHDHDFVQQNVEAPAAHECRRSVIFREGV